jgi:pseudouridine-5'-phosphate glycosidase
VQEAIQNKKPIVALESTIISTGHAIKHAAQTAIEVEDYS